MTLIAHKNAHVRGGGDRSIAGTVLIAAGQSERNGGTFQSKHAQLAIADLEAASAAVQAGVDYSPRRSREHSRTRPAWLRTLRRDDVVLAGTTPGRCR